MTAPEDDDRYRPAPTEPFASPSGEPPAWGSGPAAPPPPPLPYGQPGYGQPAPYGDYGAPGQVPPGFGAPGFGAPGFGAPGQFARANGRATTSLVLGIIACVSTVLCFCTYGVALIGTLGAPFAIWLGLSARAEIDRDPQAWNNRGVAQAGFVTGIIGTALGIIEIIIVVVAIVFATSTDGMY